jgi:putative oxidoreductase
VKRFEGGWQLSERHPVSQSQQLLHRNVTQGGSLLTRSVWQIIKDGGTNPSWGLAVLRLVTGGVFLASGAQKLFHVGPSGVAGMFGAMHIPAPLVSAVVVTLIEFLGGIALLLGLFTRSVAALLAMDMLVAVLVVYLEPALFKGGVEFPLTLLAAGITLALSGPGAASLESFIPRRCK